MYSLIVFLLYTLARCACYSSQIVKGIQNVMLLYFILQSYTDAEELDEEDKTYHDILELKKGITREVIEEIFTLNYRRNKYLQPIFKKMIDYFKCCTIIKETRSAFSHKSYKLIISYGPIENESVYTYIDLAEGSEIKECLKKTNSFFLQIEGLPLESKDIEEFFNKKVCHMSLETCIKYLFFTNNCQQLWNRIIKAYATSVRFM